MITNPRFLACLAGVYQTADGTKIGRLEIAKTLASRILKLSQDETASTLAKVLYLYGPFRVFLLKHFLQSLLEDVAALKRVSRVADHVNLDAKLLIASGNEK